MGKKTIEGRESIVTRMGGPAVGNSRHEPRRSVPELGDLAGRIRIADDFEEWPPDLDRVLGIAQSE